MDLLIEKGDSRTYLSQLKVLVTKFEEGAPAITRNSTQIQGRNGNVDFGGWHTSKEIEVEGFYRADDLDEETILRERLYALLSDTDGFYITEMRGELTPDFERPGENEGNLYEQLTTRPSHKRFFVYAKSIEPELQGNIGGAVLYKLTMIFTTMKLPYGESVPRDLDIKPNLPYYGENLALRTAIPITLVGQNVNNQSKSGYRFSRVISIGTLVTVAFDITSSTGIGTYTIQFNGNDVGGEWQTIDTGSLVNGKKHVSVTLTSIGNNLHIWQRLDNAIGTVTTSNFIISTVPSLWNPAPSDPEYKKWYLDTYYSVDNLVIPYSGTVPCNQLEQGFTIEFTAKENGSNLTISLNGTDFIAPGNVVSGDVFKLSGYEYLRNGISIVKATNKAYFKLLPGVANKISSSIKGTIRILGYQDLYA